MSPSSSTSSASGSGRIWTLVLVSVALFMVVLDNLVVIVALPSIHRDLGSRCGASEFADATGAARRRGIDPRRNAER